MNQLLPVSLLIGLLAGPVVGDDSPVLSRSDGCSPLLFCDRQCQPTPGAVDRCTSYWTIKLVRNGLVLDFPIWVPNEDPAACGRAVAHNLERLTEFYGRRPEISAPNASLLQTLAELEVPPLRPLAGGDGADLPGDDPEQPLLLRIHETQERLANLARSIDRHESFVATSAVWADALEAGQRLDSRVAGLDGALSAATAWPAIEELAIATWNLAVCNNLNADVVADVKRRLEQEEPMSAWSFAFGEDWVAFTRPFGSSGLDRFASLGLPFFVEASEVVAERRERTLFTQRDVRKFREGVADLVGKMGSLVADRFAQQSATLEALRTTFASELAVVTTLHAALDTTAEALGVKKGELDQATADRDRLAADINRQQNSIAEADRQLAVLREASLSARANHERDRTATAKARERLDAAQAQLEAIVLDCNGADYDSCPDQAAKLDYDRRRYEAQGVLSTARQEFMVRLTQEVDSLEAVGEAERQVVDQEAAASGLRTALGGMLAQVDGAKELVSRLESEWRQMEDEVLPLRSAMSGLDQAVASINIRLEM